MTSLGVKAESVEEYLFATCRREQIVICWSAQRNCLIHSTEGQSGKAAGLLVEKRIFANASNRAWILILRRLFRVPMRISQCSFACSTFHAATSDAETAIRECGDRPSLRIFVVAISQIAPMLC